MSATAELYEITVEDQTYTWTSGDTSIDYNGDTYTPETIGRSSIEQAEEVNRSDIEIRVPVSNALAQLYLTTIPDYRASVTIYRQAGGTPLPYWKGRIAGHSAGGSEVQFDCESVFSSLRRKGLRSRYTPTCRHALYHRGCWLDPEDFATEAEVTAISTSGLELTIPDAALEADGYYTGGLVRDGRGILRWILSHAGEVVVINRPFTDGAISGSGYGELYGYGYGGSSLGYGQGYGQGYGGVFMKIYPGCPRTEAICASRFSNHLNHGGYKALPDTNPLDGTSIV